MLLSLFTALCLSCQFFILLPITHATDTSKATYLNSAYYNNLVPDSDFIAKNSMSVTDIQNFLVSMNSYLAVAPSSQLGDGANNRSAAQIIWDAAQANYSDAQGTLNGITVDQTTGTISPRSILVTLNKEQGLITNSSYNQNALDCAMGYEGGNGCTWMFQNKPEWKGFTHQVGWASWQLRYNFEAAGKDAAWWSTHYTNPYYVGYSRSHSDTTTGIYYIVTYKNQATAALFRYTPYVASGNYNFWRWMIDWFGIGAITLGGGQQTFNDTEALSQDTYRTSIQFAGTKASDSFVYYGGSQITGSGATSWGLTINPDLGNHEYDIIYKDSGGNQIGQKAITINRRKLGDVNGDGKVDLLDASLMANSWGLTVKDDASLNLNPQTDNVVDLLDFSILANNFER